MKNIIIGTIIATVGYYMLMIIDNIYIVMVLMVAFIIYSFYRKYFGDRESKMGKR